MVKIKRSVIQIANSTQLISLPRKWSQKYNLKKGDELDIEENGSKLTIRIDKGVELTSKEIDITGLDRTTILYYLQSLYRMGYDEIHLKFQNPTTAYFRKDEEISVIKVINQEVKRLIGFEVIQQKENYCLIKDISTSSIKEFDTILRRIFLLINDSISDLLKGAKEKNMLLIENIEEKHDLVTKFVSYCSRLLNKYSYHDAQKTNIVYHIIGDLDKIIDVIKNAGRDLLNFKKSMNAKSIQLIEIVDSNIRLYSEFFYKFDPKKAVEMYKNRNDMINLLFQQKNKIPVEELIMLAKMEHILELITDMQVARMGIEDHDQ